MNTILSLSDLSIILGIKNIVEAYTTDDGEVVLVTDDGNPEEMQVLTVTEHATRGATWTLQPVG